MGLVERLLSGERRALARVVSIVEQGGEDARRALRLLYPHAGKAHILGVTGPPGSGKSTLVNEVALEFRRRNCTIAIVAVDPSSPFTGGAILGDRIRMQPLGGDPGVFVRSMATRGQLGGLAQATSDVVKVFDAAGFDIVIVETVGAGQAEVEIADEAHTTIVVEAPGLGDDVQSIKAGILEIADIFVVNKADREDAGKVHQYLQMMLRLGDTPRDGWEIPICRTVATRGEGVHDVADAVERHRAYLGQHGRRARRDHDRDVRELHATLGQMALDLVLVRVPNERRADILSRMEQRVIDPYAAAEELLDTALGVVSPS